MKRAGNITAHTQKTLKIARKTLTSMNNLATVLRDQGKYEQVEEMHQQALAAV
jgi:Tetratricopeptide repeat